ncbi:MAG: hypothetical protein SFY80_02245 [Verrucomicrobiota bacterium]|nr:hypothetical protein [Verrucomicrobiota bacterium]
MAAIRTRRSRSTLRFRRQSLSLVFGKEMLSTLRNLSNTTKQVIRGICFLVPFYIWAWTFLSGFTRWPHAPLREVGGQFIDKRGHLFTFSEFAAYQQWESDRFTQFGGILAFATALIVSWILGLPLWTKNHLKVSLETSDDFLRFFQKFMIGVGVATALLILISWLTRK